MLTELNMNRKNPNPLNTIADKTLKRGRKSPQDVQKMNATTTTTTTWGPNRIDAETYDAGYTVDGAEALFKGVRAIENNGYRVYRVYLDANGGLHALAYNGFTWACGRYIQSVRANDDGTRARISWAWGHYHDDAGDAWEELGGAGMACVWDIAYDGGF